jgi:signal transduction histidine kinase
VVLFAAAMKQLYLRIYLTVIAALALFALVSGWLVQRHLDDTRLRAEQRAEQRAEGLMHDRAAAWGELLQRSLPEAHAPPAEQAAALLEWSQRLRLPLALDDARGQRLAASDSFARRMLDGSRALERAQPIKLDDGRTLWVMRRGGLGRRGPDEGAEPVLGVRGLPVLRPWWAPWPPQGPGRWPDGMGLLLLLLVLFVAIAAGAWPVVRRLTRRLEALKQGVEAFGAGDLQRRVVEEGADEVGALAASFNRTAGRIQALVQSHKSLLANASHELRSPLARLKMAVDLLDESPSGPADGAPAHSGSPAGGQPQGSSAASAPASPGADRQALRREIHANIAELDALVDEVLLASRLDGAEDVGRREWVDLAAVAAEEAAKVHAQVQGLVTLRVQGVERLLRRAVRNLLENARRYGQNHIELNLRLVDGGCGSAEGDGVVAPVGLGKGCAVMGSAGAAAADPLGVGAQRAELRVCDRGPGVPVEHRERIFEAFFRLPGHTEREGGVGLGLALVRQIAHRHQGTVRCESREGGGSCFVLTLPVT